MNRPLLAPTCLLAIACVSLGTAQAPKIAPRTADAGVPRTPWGHPDFRGRWTNATVTPLERPAELGGKEFFTEPEALDYQRRALQRFLELNNARDEAAFSGEFVEGVWVEERTIVPTRRTSLIVGPDGRIPPFTPEAQKRAGARAIRIPDRADSWEDRTLGERCLWFQIGGPPMLPGLGYNSNYQIFQTPTHVAILAEQGYMVRTIPLDGRQHVNPDIRLWHGDSRGRWEGDTLIVETTNFNDKVEFRGSSSSLHLIERFRRIGADTIMYEFTATDPATWTRPWSAEIPMRPLQGLIYEAACHEGNYGLVNILQGARFAERAAKN